MKMRSMESLGVQSGMKKSLFIAAEFQFNLHSFMYHPYLTSQFMLMIVVIELVRAQSR